MKSQEHKGIAVECINLLADKKISLYEAKNVISIMDEMIVDIEKTLQIVPINEIAPETIRVRGAKYKDN